jgi:hypothetical protein
MMENNNTNKKWWKIRLLFVPEGAFLFWALKGFKGTFDEEYIEHYLRNFIITWIIRIIIFYILFHNERITFTLF